MSLRLGIVAAWIGLLGMLSSCLPETRKEVVSYHPDGSVEVERILEIHKDTTIPVREVHYHANGAVKMEGALNPQGLRHGNWNAFFPDGTPWSKGSFRDGVEHGKREVWYDNGQKRYQGQFEDGKRIGDWRFWDQNGKLIQEETYE